MGLLYPDMNGVRPTITDKNGISRKAMSYEAAPGKYGDPDGAKSTTDVLYLLPALKAGLEVRDMNEVRLISRVKSGYDVQVRDLRRWRSYRISAPFVVVAAGTMNTNSLMRQSVDARALGDLPSLGMGLGANGDLIGGWAAPKDGSRDASLGPPAHGGS